MRTRKGLIAPLNDRTALGQSDPSPRFDADDWSVAGSIGAGVEYFVAYNRALGIESKYIFEHPDVQIGTMNTDFGLDSILLILWACGFFYP